MRVLVVDDDEDVRTLLRHVLGDGETVEASDGLEAMSLLRSGGSFDAVILDVMMPGMSGFAVLKEIRSDGQLRNLPVIMLTARAGEPDHLVGYRGGADAYITKPFSVDVLVDTVEHVLAASVEQRKQARSERVAEAELLVRVEASFNR